MPKNDPAPAAYAPLDPAHVSFSRALPEWLISNGVSLAFTSYQTGGLFLVGVDAQHRLAFHQVNVERAMGLWAGPEQIVLATRNQVIRFVNMLPPGETMNGADRHFIPRVAHTTGDIDAHDVTVLGDGRIVVVNTSFSCLSTLSDTHSFRPIWQPPFISRLAPEDRCHLNGLATRDGKLAYVTATSRADVVNGWRARRSEGGCVIDVATNAIVTEKLSMPHSPRWHDNQRWLLNAGTGHLGTIDVASGAFSERGFCPGFLRGLTFHGHYALVGLSLPREGSFAGLELDAELKRRDADPWCGLQIVDTRNGDIVHWVRFEGTVTELFDVAVLPGVRCPVATAPTAPEINSLISIEVD